MNKKEYTDDLYWFAKSSQFLKVIRPSELIFPHFTIIKEWRFLFDI